jgi:hypothetical protein
MRLVPVILLTALLAGPGNAEELAAPQGQVVLTVSGAITKPNRGAFDEFEDSFIKFHERRFDKAARFDLAMLESLGMHEITIAFDKWPRPFRFAGPWLKDVLSAAGAAGTDITLLALDGYATEIGAAELDANDWLLAVKRDGRYLDIGKRGPLWLVYARRDGKPADAEDDARWPFAVFLIEVE